MSNQDSGALGSMQDDEHFIWVSTSFSSCIKRHEDGILGILRQLPTDGNTPAEFLGQCKDDLQTHIKEMMTLRQSALDALHDKFSSMGMSDDTISEACEDSEKQAQSYYSNWTSKVEFGTRSSKRDASVEASEDDGDEASTKKKKNKRKRKKTKKKSSSNFSHPTKIIERWDLLGTNGGRQIIVAETNILRQVQLLIGKCFDVRQPGNPFRLAAEHIICVLGTLTKYNKLQACWQRSSAKVMESVPDFNVETAVGTLLCQCEASRTKAIEVPSQADSELFKLKTAIYRNDKGDDNAQATPQQIERAISKERLEDVIVVGHTTTKLLTHLFHAFIMRDLIDNLTVHKNFAGLGRKDEDGVYQETKRLLQHAEDLAQRVNPDESFDEETTVFVYVTAFIFPALEMDGDDDNDNQRVNAMEVACDIFAHITKTDGREERKHIVKTYDTVQSKSVLGGVQESGEDYCSGVRSPHSTQRIFRDRRNRMRDFFFFNWFRVAIERQLPLGFFSKYGYTCTLLRMSPSDISRHASMFLTREFFNVVHEEGSSIAQKVKSSIIDKKFKSKDDETGARTIIIETQDQVESLQKLLEEFARFRLFD